MDVKSVFLYKKIKEDVYVFQPPGFEDPDFPDRVYKVEKALYGLHQAPRAWYETLLTYLLDNGFQRGKIDKTLFIKRYKGDILLVQVYVDDIIFGSTKMELCIAFEKLMHEKFQMSSMGELTFFLGLQVKQKKDGIFISQDKYADEIFKKFGFTEVKTASTPMETQKPLLKDGDGEEVYVHMYRSMIGSLMYLTSSRPDIIFAVCACARYQVNPKYPNDSPLDLVAYSDSDYAGESLDKKSTIKGCQFLRCRLISWQCKKHTVVATSTTEAEYVAALSCCGQLYLILLGKAKKSVKLMMEKLLRMELELILFWSTVKAKTINGEEQLHALVDGKKIIITESSVRRDLQLADEEGVDCLPNSTIFEQLTLMGPKTIAWNEFSSTMASAIICLATNQKFNFSKFIFESMIRNLDNLSGKFLMYPSAARQKLILLALSLKVSAAAYFILSAASMINAASIFLMLPVLSIKFLLLGEMITSQLQGKLWLYDEVHKAVHKELGDSLVRAATTASSLEAEQDSGNINKTKSKATPNESSSLGTTLGGGPRCQETIGDTIAQTRFESVSKHSNDSLLARGNTLQSDEDRLKLDELMTLCTTLQNRVLDLEKTKTTQHNDISILKKRVKKLEKKNRSRTHKLKRLYKVGLTARVESSNNEESLGEDASKQGRIDAIDADEKITLVSVQNIDEEMFDVNDLDEVVEVINSVKLNNDDAQVSAAGNVVSTAGDATTVSAATTTTATITTVDDITFKIFTTIFTTITGQRSWWRQRKREQNRTGTRAYKEAKMDDDKRNIRLKLSVWKSFPMKKSLGEDASKQGRIDAIDADEEITLVSVHDVNVSAGEEEVVEVINTAKLIIDAAQDKGKGILIEPVKSMKKKDQIGLDEETALKRGGGIAL
ncbi:putative ribonuclease H-like domain-containing protein [Tanacetum coccineum]